MPEEPLQPQRQGITDDATISFDAEGRVLSVTDSAASTLGYEGTEELLGAPLAALIGDEAAIVLLDQVAAADELETENGLTSGEMFAAGTGGSVTFIRGDGSRISLNTVVTPETSGGWITLLDTSGGGSTANVESIAGISERVDVAGILRKLAEQSGSIGDVAEITARFATEISAATGADAVTVARSSAIAGIYEPLARVSKPGTSSLTETIDLPPALVPQQGAGPIAVESLETLALFEPVVIYGEEFDGAYIASRADLHDGAHLIVIATAQGGKEWSESATLLLESGVLTLAGTLRATELDRRIASYSRASETVRQIGALASRDHDGGFLDAARKVIARRLPVSAISIHVADTVTGRCYVPDASSAGDEEYGALAPGVEWPLAGSIEQRVLKTGAAVFTSAASSERLSVPPATIAHWRRSGLQAVVAIPLREAGEVVAIMLAGFSSPVSNPKEVIRLLESIAPAVHLGVGLSAGRPGVTIEPEDAEDDPGFISPKTLLALTRAAAESPDNATLFASVTEWMLEIIPSSKVSWGTIDRSARTYRQLYSYDSLAAAPADEVPVPLEGEVFNSLDIAGLGLPEPGHSAVADGSMRAAVMSGGRVLGVVTAWPQVDESFSTTDLARLQRVCEFVSGPLSRTMAIELVQNSQDRKDLVTQIGALAVEFTEPSQAFRALGSKIDSLFSHDRALFIDLDLLEESAEVRYDSAAMPGELAVERIPFALLPSHDIVAMEEPFSASVADGPRTPADMHASFADCDVLLAIPMSAGDGRNSVLLLLSAERRSFDDEQMSLASALAVNLKGALAGWNAHASERELRHQVIDIRKQLSLVLDSTPIALITTDAEGVCRSLEGHGLETLGLKREDMHGASIFDFTSKYPQLEDAVRQAMRGMMATALTSLGSHSVEIWAQPITETDGTVKGVTLVGYDVSDRVRVKRANSERRDLEATLKERSETIERASHELRNQLQSIIAYADILSVGTDDSLSQTQTQALSVIQKTASKLDTMIGDLPGLDYELGLSAVDVSNLMQEIVDAQEPIFTSAGQDLSLILPDAQYTVQADHLRLSQVVTNLLSNASKYSPEGASVAIDVSIEEQFLNISVSDTGPGIPADQLERVWDTGIRLAASGASRVQGSGLGLAIARKIVEMHGGTASIESEVGLGTTVTVILPGARLIDEAEPAKSGSTKGGKAAGRQKRRRQRSGT